MARRHASALPRRSDRRRRADIVGFGDAGVWVALNNGNGTFQAPQLVVANFGYNAGGWRVDRHPRFLADLTGDGRADIVGFGNAGRLGRRSTTATAPSRRRRWWSRISAITPAAGASTGIRSFLADLTGDGRADIVGFGNAGVWVALNKGNGTFSALPRKSRDAVLPGRYGCVGSPSARINICGGENRLFLSCMGAKVRWKICDRVLLGHWIHSHEEDAHGVTVYRRKGYSFPPSRGRRGV